jgi:hypothetical protein
MCEGESELYFLKSNILLFILRCNCNHKSTFTKKGKIITSQPKPGQVNSIENYIQAEFSSTWNYMSLIGCIAFAHIRTSRFHK